MQRSLLGRAVLLCCWSQGLTEWWGASSLVGECGQASSYLDLGGAVECCYWFISQRYPPLGSSCCIVLSSRSNCWLLSLVPLPLALDIAYALGQELLSIRPSLIINNINWLPFALFIVLRSRLISLIPFTNHFRGISSGDQASVGYHPIIQVITCITHSTHGIGIF